MEKYLWTKHSEFKMKQYNLSQQRIKRVIRFPKRIEEGIVKKTVAVMQPSSTKIKDGKENWSQEIWAMYQLRGSEAKKIKGHPVKSSLKRSVALPQFNRVKIISAWRYPGVSPKNNPIPEEILEELGNLC